MLPAHTQPLAASADDCESSYHSLFWLVDWSSRALHSAFVGETPQSRTPAVCLVASARFTAKIIGTDKANSERARRILSIATETVFTRMPAWAQREKRSEWYLFITHALRRRARMTQDGMRMPPAQAVNASDVWEDAGASSGICAPQLAEQRVQARAARCEPLWIFSRSARSKRYPRSVLTLKSARGCKQKSAIRQLVLGAGVALEIDVWFEFCCSEANVADWPHDWPSRGLLQFAADPGGEGG